MPALPVRRHAVVALLAAAWLALAPLAHADDDDEHDDATVAGATADPAGRPQRGIQRDSAGASGAAASDKAAARAAAQPAGAPDQEDALTRVRGKGILRVGVYRNFAPFHDDGKGGIDDDIGAELARRLGVKVSVQSYMPADEMADDFRNILWKGHYMGMPLSDVMLHVPTDEALQKSAPQVKIFGAYANEQTVVMYDRERVSAWRGMESLGNLRAGVETQSMPDMWLLSFGSQYKSQVEHYPDLGDAVRALRSGSVQVVLGSRIKIESALGEDNGRYQSAVFNGGVYGKALDLGLAVKAGETALEAELARAVQAMREDGTLKALFARHHATWLAPDPGH